MVNAILVMLQAMVAALLVRFTEGSSYLIDATAAAHESTQANSSWTGELKLFQKGNFQSLLLTLTFNTANLCFNLACGALDDDVSSASWKGLPLSAHFPGGTSSLLMFYRGIDCTGINQGWPTSNENTPSFADVGMNDLVSSFMFLENDTGVQNGVQSICDYKMTTVA